MQPKTNSVKSQTNLRRRLLASVTPERLHPNRKNDSTARVNHGAAGDFVRWQCCQSPARRFGSQETITDKTGAVVPDAALTVTNQATGEARAAKANAEGGFNFLTCCLARIVPPPQQRQEAAAYTQKDGIRRSQPPGAWSILYRNRPRLQWRLR